MIESPSIGKLDARDRFLDLRTGGRQGVIHRHQRGKAGATCDHFTVVLGVSVSPEMITTIPFDTSLENLDWVALGFVSLFRIAVWSNNFPDPRVFVGEFEL